MNIAIDSKTFITKDSIFHKGEEYPISEITKLSFSAHKQSINFVPMGHHRALSIGFRDGRTVVLMAMHPILGRAKFNAVAEAFKALSPMTFTQRLVPYIDAWKNLGYFHYQDVIIDREGNLIRKKTKIALGEAIRQKSISFGLEFGLRSFSTYHSDPSYIYVQEKVPGKFFSSGIGFTCVENRDVILALIFHFDPNKTSPK